VGRDGTEHARQDNKRESYGHAVNVEPVEIGRHPLETNVM
jgi:hypothetical protein